MSYADAIKIMSWIISIYAIGDGLGLFLAKKLYGSLSVRQTLNLTIICSVIASLIYAFAGSLAAYDDTASSIFRHLVTARILMGICEGMTYLTQQAYIGQVLTKESNNEL